MWDPPPGNPGSGADIFANSVYERGAATLQALREKVGDATFFAILQGLGDGARATATRR